MKIRLVVWLLGNLFALVLLATSAQATVTNIVWYRLGENDPGATNGTAVASTTTDLMGFENLQQFGNPVYTNAVSTSASNNVGSSLAIEFNGTSQYLSNSPVSTATTLVGVEAWVKPDNTVGGVNRVIVFNGNTGANGWGIYQNGTSYFAILGGGVTVGTGTAVAGTWTHLALVLNNPGVFGTGNSFYVNSISVGVNSSVPVAPSGGFAIGAPPEAPTTRNFIGAIDEVRVFTFGLDGSGNSLFSTNDLLFKLQRVTTAGAPSFSSTNAVLDGLAYPPGLPTAGWFEWGTTTNYGNVTPALSFGAAAGSTNFTQSISNLVNSTTYHFRASVSNSLGVATGADNVFTTLGPSVQTLPANGIDVTSATLNGVVPGGSSSASTVWFQWGTTTSYGNLTPTQVVPAGGQSFSQNLSGLLANTTYQFTAVASNNLGLVTGSNQSFTTLLPLTVSTLAATALTTSSATLNATANPGGVGANGFFEYGTTTNYGTTTASQSLGSGTSSTNFSQAITGLTAGSTYHFRADAARSTGVVMGGDQTFTAPMLPNVTTLTPTAVTPATATLNGSGTPNGAATMVWFIWGPTVALTNVTAPQPAGVSGNTNFNQAIAGLAGGTQYAVQAVASNAAGVVLGSSQFFTTPPAPAVTTLPASTIDATTATLNGATPVGSSAASVWFQWGTTISYGNLTPAQAVPAGGVSFGQGLSNLLANTTYQFTAVLSNSFGVAVGSNQSFTTLLPLTVATLPPSALTTNSATLNATANPGGVGANGFFEYGTTTNYGTTTASQSLGSGTSSTNFSQAITGLTAGSTYHFRADAARSTGVVMGGDQTFTAPLVPTVIGLPASAVTGSSATLNGSANPENTATVVWFQWGPTPAMTNTTLPQPIGSGSVGTPFSQYISGLNNNTLYFFRAVASNTVATVFDTTDESFTTLSPPAVTTLGASAIGAATATLNGSANPSGSPTSVWFEWGTTTNYGNLTPALPIGSANEVTNFTQVVTGLLGGVTYNFRADASNTVGVVNGTNQTFAVPVFVLAFTNVTGTFLSTIEWGDYDNDGRLDIALSGATNLIDVLGGNNDTPVNQIWRNTGNGFTNINLPLPQLDMPAVWADYNGDGYLDLLSGNSLWQNTGTGFTNVSSGLPSPGNFGLAVWGDYDNDGLLDVLVTGFPLGTQLWRNTGAGFTNVSASVFGLELSGYRVAQWVDYDNDGRLDLLLASDILEPTKPTLLLRNTGTGFTNVNSGLPSLGEFGSAAWGDYDRDGRPDVLITGVNDTYATQIWRNTANGFTNINAGLPGVRGGAAAWGDYDNDGQLDILLTGATTNDANGVFTGFISQVWRNTGSGFTNINAGLPGVGFRSAAAWGDYDNDGRLDFIISGEDANTNLITQVWKNNIPSSNTPPSAPTGLAVIPGVTATLTWQAATDTETPSAGLTYNVRIGTTPGASDVLAPMSGANGFRRLPQFGNQGARLSATFAYTLGTAYYWSVQAVDSSFAGSPFASEGSFKILTAVVPPTATNIVPGDINGDGIVSQSELNVVLSNYFANSPLLFMTNVAGLGGTNVSFSLSNSTAGSFSVLYSTNLTDWQFLGPAIPRYLFIDTNAPAQPQRYYRLQWP